MRYALQYNEFFKADEIAKARTLLQQGEERAAQLAAGTGAVDHRHRPGGARLRLEDRRQRAAVRARRAALVFAHAPHRWRLDAWFHGRDETLSEVNFLADRAALAGRVHAARHHRAAPLRALLQRQQVRRRGGSVRSAGRREAATTRSTRTASWCAASAWAALRPGTSATHYAGLWAAVAPGAGFSETGEFLQSRPSETSPPAWEQKLWHLYDATDYAVNLFNCPTVAYNGEIDPQKQAADMMEKAMAEEGMRLIRVDRAADAAPLSSRFEGRDRPHARRHRRARARPLPAQGALHHLDAGLQPDEVGDGRRAGQALGTRARGCRDHRRVAR